jgi:cephalosporin-C deacetylase-like acetyl esterase
MAIKTFDRYFMNMPGLTREDDFHKFWDKSINDIKKVPIEPEINESEKGSTSKFRYYDISYNGFLKVRVKGYMLVPKNASKPKIIIHLHDYNRYPDKDTVKILDDRCAHLFPVLRGHEMIKNRSLDDTNERALGFIVENIIDLQTYYARSVFLDIYRSIDFLRLMKFIDCSEIGIYGKGFGAAAGFFTAAYSDRVKAIVMDSPIFCDIPLVQNLSDSDASREINDIIAVQKNKKSQIKKNLSYFDIINFSDNLACPVLFITGLKDSGAPAECVMGLFNRLQCSKYIEIYPDEGADAGGENQKKAAVNWLADIISN